VQGDADDAAGRLRRVERLMPRGSVWHRRAHDELLLLGERDPEYAPMLECQPLDTRPYLDGQLREACWQVEPTVSVARANSSGDGSDAGGSGDALAVWLARDDQYFFLAARDTSIPSRERGENA